MKYLKYLILAIIVAYTALVPGKVAVDWLGYHIEVSVAIATASVSLLIVVYWLTKGLIRRMFGFVRNFYSANKTEKILDVIASILIALTRKDYKEADRQLSRSRKLVKSGHPLMTWLEGNYRAAVGDSENANLLFFNLSNNDKYRFLGAYSQYKLRVESSQSTAAFKVAQNYLAKNHKDFFFLEQVVALAVKEKDYELALNYQANLPISLSGQENEAVICYMLAQSQSGEDKEVRLEQACKLDSGLVPAALEYARCLVNKDRARKAEKYLWKCWEKNGHYRCILDLHELLQADDKERLNMARKAVELIPDRWDSHYIAGLAYLDAQLLVTAREYLSKAWQILRTQEVYDLLKSIDDRDMDLFGGAFDKVHWTCRKCSVQSEDWMPICPRCESFNSLKWFSNVPDTELMK
jgi:HemY protein